MSDTQTELGPVGKTIRDLLPIVNDGLDWEMVKTRYDSRPEGTAMSLHLTDESGDQKVEQVYLGIAPGPELVVLDHLSDEWDYIGAIVTYQKYGRKILDAGDPMTPDRARYTHGGVTVHPHGDESRERVWFVVKNVLDIMLESIVWAQQSGSVEGEA